MKACDTPCFTWRPSYECMDLFFVYFVRPEVDGGFVDEVAVVGLNDDV